MNEVNLRLIWHTVQRTYENKTVGTSPPSCPPDPLLRLCQRSTSRVSDRTPLRAELHRAYLVRCLLML